MLVTALVGVALAPKPESWGIPDLFAAFVVLTLALVAVYMPINPVADEQTAPIMNATVLAKPRP